MNTEDSEFLRLEREALLRASQPEKTVRLALPAKDNMEIVGYQYQWKFTDNIWREVTDGSARVPFYTTPPQRPWVGLTEEEKAYSNTDYAGKCSEAWQGGVDWAEAKLKELNI